MLPLPPNAEQAGKQEREREGERGLPSAQAPEQSKGRERERGVTVREELVMLFVCSRWPLSGRSP